MLAGLTIRSKPSALIAPETSISQTVHVLVDLFDVELDAVDAVILELFAGIAGNVLEPLTDQVIDARAEMLQLLLSQTSARSVGAPAHHCRQRVM